MSFADGTTETKIADAQLGVSAGKDGWAVRHNGGVLGYAKTQAEAVAICKSLRDWVEGRGGRAELTVAEAGQGWDGEPLGAAAQAGGRGNQALQ